MATPQTRFQGAHALFFGGAKGIGAALARVFARRGTRLTIADIDLAAAEETCAAITRSGGSARAVPADVLSDAQIAAAAVEAEAGFGAIDILVNNVGAIINGHPEDLPAGEWDRIAELNYGAALRGTRQVLGAMLARRHGTIVNTASFAGMYPYASTRIPYGAAKAAVISLSQNLALHCEPRGVRVCCLLPGPVRTGIAATMKNWTPDASPRGPGAHLRVLAPEEAAVTFADGIEQGRIMIPSDDALWTIVRSWADDPDAFIRGRIAAAAAGDLGLPAM